MKYLTFLLLMLLTLPAHAIRMSEVMSAISCNSVADNNFFMNKFTQTFDEPRIENGAAWFTASGEIYGSKIREVFVSTTRYTFVGVVLESRPTEVIKNIPTSPQYPTRVFPSGETWVGADGREIVWHAGMYTKIFCNKGTW